MASEVMDVVLGQLARHAFPTKTPLIRCHPYRSLQSRSGPISLDRRYHPQNQVEGKRGVALPAGAARIEWGAGYGSSASCPGLKHFRSQQLLS
jgi:hypothetical protein